MDQDSFRHLLATSSTTPKQSSASWSYNPKPKPKPKTLASSDSASTFKPRKVNNKTKEFGYRDRATERRTGTGVNDYAQAEALLEDFEKRNAIEEDKTSLDAQRAYLGGDAEHTILVKGLDMALLEQNKARLQREQDAQFNVDDDTLEQAFLGGPSAEPSASAPKKKTRAELLKELKETRAGGTSTNQPPSDATAQPNTKFKPIGFKPIGSSEDKPIKKKKKKKAEAEGDEGRKKKKRKVEKSEPDSSSAPAAPAAPTAQVAPKPKPHKPEDDVDMDADIFADVGEYEGLDVDSDQEEEHEQEMPSLSPSVPQQSRGWFNDDPPREPEPTLEPPEPSSLSAPIPSSLLSSGPPRRSASPSDEEQEEPGMMRLQPLSSSVLLDIKGLLAADDVAGMSRRDKINAKKAMKAEKRAAREAEGGGDDEKGAIGERKGEGKKLDRDYKRLKEYQDRTGR